jgi:hypothetical protein
MSPNVKCSVSLENYNPYLHPQKVSKNKKIHCIHNSLPKNAKIRFGFLGPLGINKDRKSCNRGTYINVPLVHCYINFPFHIK